MVIFCNRGRKETPVYGVSGKQDLIRGSLRRHLQLPGAGSFARTRLDSTLYSQERTTPRTGALMVEFLVALALVLGALLPLAYSFAKEEHLTRAYYQRAIAIELVDGEMELLAAGGWKGCAMGTSEYRVR